MLLQQLEWTISTNGSFYLTGETAEDLQEAIRGLLREPL
jgi:hypothetical protein